MLGGGCGACDERTVTGRFRNRRGAEKELRQSCKTIDVRNGLTLAWGGVPHFGIVCDEDTHGSRSAKQIVGAFIHALWVRQWESSFDAGLKAGDVTQ